MKKRNGYYYRDDKEYVSVTKVLSDVLAKPALYYWYKQQAARIALKNPELSEKEVISMVDLVSSASKDRGHFVHSIAETMPTNIDINTVEESYRGYIKGLVDWWGTIKPSVLHSEIELFTDKHMFAGRCDKIVRIGSEVWVIDFKTGKDLYKEVGLQLAAYKYMSEEMGIAIDKTGALLLMEDGGWKFCQTNDSIEDFVNVLNVYKWMRRKE